MPVKTAQLHQATEVPVPEILRHIGQPPEHLFHIGTPLNEILKKPRVAIVGSRNMTPYGKQVTIEFASQLAARGIVIISGLALGVDGTAHRATLDASGTALAVLPSSLDHIVPTSHERLAHNILQSGGALVSEYPPGSQPYKYNFVERNRLMSGLADAVLVIEAREGSGSLHTVDFANNQGKDVLIVPGNITSRASAGSNAKLKAGEGQLVTSYLDVLSALHIDSQPTPIATVRGRTTYEQTVLDLLQAGTTDGHELLQRSRLDVSDFNQVLTMLEIGGQIRALGANSWRLA